MKSQTVPGTSVDITTRHGTCATAVMAPFGVAFAIDSRITVEDANGAILEQVAGCKVILARPNILIAGVGLEDSSGRVNHWNSLDAASVALKGMPQIPTEKDVDEWSLRWKDSLIHHLRVENKIPKRPELVSEILFMTMIGGQPYFQRTTVRWNGSEFRWEISTNSSDLSRPYVEYSGACRDFVGHNDGLGTILRSKFPHTQAEDKRLEYWGSRKGAAKTTTDLADAAYGFESVLADIDARLEPDHPVIAPPFAFAEWSVGDKQWTTSFNAECKPAVVGVAPAR